MAQRITLRLPFIPIKSTHSVSKLMAPVRLTLLLLGAISLSLQAPPVFKDPARLGALNYHFPAAAGGFSPADIAGLTWWPKADAISLSDNDPVGAWPDSSISVNDATQGTAAKKPIFKTGILNGKPVVRFDGTDDTLVAGAAIGITGNHTYFVVVKMPNADYASPLWVTADDGAGVNLTGRADGSIDYGIPWSQNSGASYYDGTSFYIFSLTFDGTTYRLRKNGTGLVSAATASAPSNRTPRIGKSDALPTALNGDLAEIIIYNSTLSQTDHNLVGNHLATKYGLTWTDL